MNTLTKRYILFDDECYLCNGFVKRLHQWDKKGIYYFVPLGSNFGLYLRAQNSIPEHIDSVVVVSNEGYKVKSDAVLSILTTVGLPYLILGSVASIFPLIVRDYIYDIIAKNRKKWFGSAQACDMASRTLIDRFILEAPEKASIT